MDTNNLKFQQSLNGRVAALMETNGRENGLFKTHSVGSKAQFRILQDRMTSKSESDTLPHGSIPNFSRSSFDLQDKVSVRLVANKGLVVESEEEDGDGDDQGSASTSSSFTSYVPDRGRYNSVSGTSNKSNSQLSATGTIIPASLPVRTGLTEKCKLTQENEKESIPQPVRHAPFNKTRHGSTSGGEAAGVSSMTPLMIGENYKMELTIKPPASYIKSQRRRSGVHLCCALVFGFAASLFFSLTLLLAKILEKRDHHPISIAFWRYVGILIISMPLILFYILRGRKEKVFGGVWPLHDMEKATNCLRLLLRVVLGSTAVILRFSSLTYLTVADTSVISYCAPVFAAIMAPLCFQKERSSLIPICTGILAISGIFLLCRPPFLPSTGGGEFDLGSLKGISLACLSTLCSSGVLLLLRDLLKRIHFSLMMFVLGLWGVIEVGVIAVSFGVLKVPQLLPDIVLLIGLAVLTSFGQWFILLAMRLGRIGSVTVIRSCDIFFAFLWQYLFLKMEPDIYAILSGFLIIFAVWCIFFLRWVNVMRSSNDGGKLQKKLAFILL